MPAPPSSTPTCAASWPTRPSTRSDPRPGRGSHGTSTGGGAGTCRAPPGTPFAEYRSGSDTDYFRGLELVRSTLLLLPEDPDLARWADLRTTYPQLEIEASAGLFGAAAYIQTIDWLSQELGPPVLLGELPIPGRRPIEPGFYRITIVRPVAGGEPCLAEYTRSFDKRGRVYALRPELRAPEEVLRGMVHVPADEYSLGDPDSQRIPQFLARRVRLPGFWIDATEVSNAQYRAFVEATGHEPPRYWSDGYSAEWDDLPVIGVTFDGAQAYAEWAGKRLPTHHEWEAAARGPQGFLFPWGDEAAEIREHAVVGRPEGTDAWTSFLASARPVGTTPGDRSPFGLLDMQRSNCHLSIPDDVHRTIAERWLKSVNVHLSPDERLWLPEAEERPGDMYMIRCCRYVGGDWYSCLALMLHIGRDLDHSVPWKIDIEIEGMEDPIPVPIRLEISWSVRAHAAIPMTTMPVPAAV